MNYYINGPSCSPCSKIPSTIAASQCNNCNGGSFGYSFFGCVNCSSIPYGTGATVSSTYGMCNCQVGYTFNIWVGACICDTGSKYALTASNTCQACLSLPSTSVSDCLSCSNSFFFSGYVCLSSTLVGNYSLSVKGCPTNYIQTTNPVTN
jgi:hypothetical protein